MTRHEYIISALVFAVLVGCACWLLSTRTAPPPFREVLISNSAYDPGAMQGAVQPEALHARLEAVLAHGSRFLGQPGFYGLADELRATYRAAGLELYELDNETVVPRTLRREILAESGRPLDGVEIYPFMPNQLQPMVTPEEGISGELVAFTDEVYRRRQRFDDCIALVDARVDRVPGVLGLNWANYARLGVKALIVAHPEGLRAMDWYQVAGSSGAMVADIPINYVRLAANERIFEHVGERVTLRVNTEYAAFPHATIIGVLRASKPASEAVIIAAAYDACSVLPDRAPGDLPAIGLALQRCLLDGLLAYRASLERDVLFLNTGAQVMACEGQNNILALLGYNRGRTAAAASDTKAGRPDAQRRDPLEKRQQANQTARQSVTGALACFTNPDFLVTAEGTAASLAKLEAGARTLVDEQIRYVINTLVFQFSEDALGAKLAFERSAERDINGPLFRAYAAAKKICDEASAAAGFTPVNLVRAKPEFLVKHDLRRLCLARFEELQAYHRQQAKRLEQSLAIVDLFGQYRDFVVVQPKLLPACGDRQQAETLAIQRCEKAAKTPAASAMLDMISLARARLGLEATLQLAPLETLEMGRSDHFMPSADHYWGFLGYPSFTILDNNRPEARWQYSSPVTLPFMGNLESIRRSAAVCAETLLLLAHGNGAVPNPTPQLWFGRSFGGRVLVSNVGPGSVPDYPLKHALVCPRGGGWSHVGFYDQLIVRANVYGRYDKPNATANFIGWSHFWSTRGYSPLAAGYGRDGLIAYMKDEGPEGQRLYKSVGLSMAAPSSLQNVSIVTFRAAPVSVLDLTNPQTIRDFSGAEFVSRDGLAAFGKECTLAAPGMLMKFVEPGSRFFVELQAGSSENELARVTRAFMLGRDPACARDPGKEIDGPGFLAIDNPLIARVPFETAASMLDVNGRRLALQNRYHMTDETTRELHDRSAGLYRASATPGLAATPAEKLAREAVAYSMLNHPLLRQAMTEAVIGILWYLGLLVPFVFFAEKLLCGFSDVRRQLAAQTVIFLAVFMLLRLLHPAFQMVQSSLMILIGFVILLISGGITLLFAGKFRENLEELNARRGKVAGAEADTLGIVVNAFVLGLNNMRRRKLRTGLTCATLILMTVVMICFTSMESDEVRKATAVGKALYQGILYKEDRFKPVGGLDALRARYGDRFKLAERRMLLGRSAGANPKLEIVYERDGLSRRLNCDSLLQFSANEPLRGQIRFVTHAPWFSEADDLASDNLCPVMLPDTLADQLGIFAADVDQGDVAVQINGRLFAVRGIFDSGSLNSLRDLDDLDLLPFDLEALERLPGADGYLLAEPSAPRIAAGRLVITPNRELGISVEGAEKAPRLVSVAILMPDLSYAEAQTMIGGHLEQTGRMTYYGLDGVAYCGERSRGRSFVGFMSLLIPLIIAALTVLNTMRGSVYERRNEIYVYNAVGIAPRYVFFMFFSEAFVFVVVGSVVGYLISQSLGRILFELDLTGGLHLTFTSLNTIYASLALAASVFASTYFPACSAMAIAAPAEDAGWKLPEPAGDRLTFDLPFTFSRRDRIAVLAFFERYLDDHSEGGAGRFFAGDIGLGVGDAGAEHAADAYVPRVNATIWLKPFDLAVSQRMRLALPTDAETGEYKAQIVLERLSGTREAWLRLNAGFVAILRRHFLHWRAVSPEGRQDMFEEARALMEKQWKQAAAQPPAPAGALPAAV